MTENRRIPKSRQRLPGEPPFGAVVEETIPVRRHRAQMAAASSNRMARIRREARTLQAPFRRPPATEPRLGSEVTESRPPAAIHIISDVVLRPAYRRSLPPPPRACPEPLVRLEWAVAHAEELFPEPARRITPAALSEPQILTIDLTESPPTTPGSALSEVNAVPESTDIVDPVQSSLECMGPVEAAPTGNSSITEEFSISEEGGPYDPSLPVFLYIGEIAEEVAANPDPREWSFELVEKLRSLRPPNHPEGRRCRRHLTTRDGRRVHVNLPR